MNVSTVGQLIDLLRRFYLLEPSQLDKLLGERGRPTDPRALAQELIRRDWLTPYQVNQLFKGRATQLFFDPYVVLKRLGEGGSSQVYQARHRFMRRIVALKVIRPELLTDQEMVNRFLREIRVASQLVHPNIVHAYDAGPLGATYFLAMEYVEGIDFAGLVERSGPLPISQACDYIRQAALGLQHAHERGLVHRDIKPSNLLLSFVPRPSSLDGCGSQAATDKGLRTRDKGQVVKVLDLGLARLQRPVFGDVTNMVTPAGPVMLGTPDYMAPEQAIDFHEADHRSDIYSLGCTLYYLLAGRPPFGGGSLAQKLMRHQQAPPPPLERFRPDTPPELERLLHRMMAKQPDHRFSSAGEVAAALGEMAGQGNGRRSGLQALLARMWAPRAARTAPEAIPVASPVAGSGKETVPVAIPVSGPGSSVWRQRLGQLWGATRQLIEQAASRVQRGKDEPKRQRHR